MCQQSDIYCSETISDNDNETNYIYDFENTDTIRAKWMFEGCKTIDEIIEKLEIEKDRFIEMKSEGWELIDTVTDDYGHIKKNKIKM